VVWTDRGCSLSSGEISGGEAPRTLFGTKFGTGILVQLIDGELSVQVHLSTECKLTRQSWGFEPQRGGVWRGVCPLPLW